MMRGWAFGAAILWVVTASACGARTGLLGGEEENLQAPGKDAGRDAPLDAVADAAPDATPDAEASVPLKPHYCPAYAVTITGDFLIFYPDTGIFAGGRHLECTPDAAQVRTMAVDSMGGVFILFSDNYIYKFDPTNGDCARTTFKPNTHGLSSVFGMAFRKTPTGDEFRALAVGALYTFDPVDFVFKAQVAAGNGLASDLQATSDGSLFGFDTYQLNQIDPGTGATLSRTPIGGLEHGAWTFLAWQGDFILFDAAPQTSGPSFVRRYHPDTKSLTYVTTYGDAINGADVPPCPPP